jgi:translation elongation factor EF-4
LGNKLDILNRQIEYEEVSSFIENSNIMFAEVSAKTGQNIHNVMNDVAKELALKTPSQDIKLESFTISNKTNKLYGCC